MAGEALSRPASHWPLGHWALATLSSGGGRGRRSLWALAGTRNPSRDKVIKRPSGLTYKRVNKMLFGRHIANNGDVPTNPEGTSAIVMNQSPCGVSAFSWTSAFDPKRTYRRRD